MKKIFLVIVSSFFCTIVFAQSEEIFTDAMSSQWIAVGNVVALPVALKPVVVKKATVRVKRAAQPPAPPSAAKPDDAFKKTNTKVKRFKKTSG